MHAFVPCVSKTFKIIIIIDYEQLALSEKDSKGEVIAFSTINRDVGMVHFLCSYMETPSSGQIRNKVGCCIP